jgi:hypothetical protein
MNEKSEMKEFVDMLRDMAARVDDMEKTVISRRVRMFDERDGKMIFRKPVQYTVKNV